MPTCWLRKYAIGNNFFNRRYSLLSFGGPQLYNSEALPFTYGQYVVLELADKLYNSVTVCFLCFSKVWISSGNPTWTRWTTALIAALFYPLGHLNESYMSFVWVHEFSSRWVTFSSCRSLGLNHWPLDYKASALPLHHKTHLVRNGKN